MTKKRTLRKKRGAKSFFGRIRQNKLLTYGVLIAVLLVAGIIGYATYQGLTASGSVCRDSTNTGRVHLTNTKLLFKDSSEVAFCVTGAKGAVVMTIRNSANTQVWTKTIQNKDLAKAPSYTAVRPDTKLQTGSYTFALLDRTTNNRVDVAFGVTGSEPVRDPYYGVNTHYIKGKTSGTDGRANLSTTYPLLDRIGVSSVRETIAWNTIEKQKNTFAIPGTYVNDFMNTARASNDPVIFVAAYGNALWTGGDAAPPVTDLDVKKFAAYIDYVLDTYPQIQYVELTNEYDHVADKTKNSRTNGTGKEYAALFKKTAQVLRNDYKQTKVKLIAGSISTLSGSGGETCQCNDVGRFNKWWEEFGAGGGFRSADYVSFHRYDDIIPSDGSAYHRRLDEIVKKYNGGESKPIIVSEVGLATSTNPQWRGVVVNERDQAAGLVRTYVAYKRSGVVTNVLWYDAIDNGIDRNNIEHNWGLFKRPTNQAPYAYQPKQAAMAFYWMRRELDDGYKLTNVTQPVAGVQQYTFTKGDSKRYILWQDKLFASNDQSSVNVTVNIRSNAPTNVYNMLGERIADRDKKYANGKITIKVQTTPTYINN